MGYYKNEAGKKYGKLTVLEYVGSTPGQKSLWRCQCECGETTIARSDKLRAGRILHCGCDRTRARRSGNPAASKVWRGYRRRAQKRDLEWSLTRELFDKLTSSPCHYCGLEPSTMRSYRGHVFVYNGIDRVHSDLGYLSHNVVPCCNQCNKAKWDIDYDEFINWVERLANHLVLK